MKEFVKPEAEIIKFDNCDIVTCSGEHELVPPGPPMPPHPPHPGPGPGPKPPHHH